MSSQAEQIETRTCTNKPPSNRAILCMIDQVDTAHTHFRIGSVCVQLLRRDASSIKDTTHNCWRTDYLVSLLITLLDVLSDFIVLSHFYHSPHKRPSSGSRSDPSLLCRAVNAHLGPQPQRTATNTVVPVPAAHLPHPPLHPLLRRVLARRLLARPQLFTHALGLVAALCARNAHESHGAVAAVLTRVSLLQIIALRDNLFYLCVFRLTACASLAPPNDVGFNLNLYFGHVALYKAVLGVAPLVALSAALVTLE